MFSCGGERAIECDFEDFTQNGCYGNQSQPFEVLFYSIVPDRLKKQDLTFKQAYFVSLCVSSCAINCSFDIQLLFSVLSLVLFGNNLIVHQTKWKSYPVSRDRR